MKKVYTIWCEWDMGFGDRVFATEELAQGAIREMDWEGYTDNTLEEVLENGLVTVEDHDFIEA